MHYFPILDMGHKIVKYQNWKSLQRSSCPKLALIVKKQNPTKFLKAIILQIKKIETGIELKRQNHVVKNISNKNEEKCKREKRRGNCDFYVWIVWIHAVHHRTGFVLLIFLLHQNTE